MAAHKTIRAVADEVVRRGASVAGGPIVAGSRGTGITRCPHFTAPAREASRAGAHEPILQVMAGAAMGTRAAGTVADMKFTVGACESRTAAAYAVRASIQALAPIGTWIAGTPIHFLLAVGASEAWGAFAGIAGTLVALPAGAAIEARGVSTAQGAVFAVQAIVTRRTEAMVAILLVLTAASIATGVAVTLAELQFTVHASVAWATDAGIAPLPTVGARCPILAWGVVGAIVEILVTE